MSKQELGLIGSLNIGKLEDLVGQSINSRQAQKWKLANINKIQKTFLTDPKIFIIGPYKVGKSTLISRVSEKAALKLGHQVNNTRGIDFYSDVIKSRQVTLIDTEGFFQPIENDDPIIREKFIMELMQNSGDILIVVFDRISTHDIKPITEMMRFYQDSKFLKSLLIIHNMKHITTRVNLDTYAQKVCQLFDGKLDEKICRVFANVKVGPFKTAKQVIHLIHGDMNLLQNEFKETIEYIRGSCSTVLPSMIDIKESIIRAALKTASEYFTISPDAEEKKALYIDDSGCIIDDGVTFKDKKRDISREPTSPFKTSQVTCNFIVTEDGIKNNYITLVVDGSGIKFDTFKINISKDGVIMLSFSKMILDGSKMNLININEEVISPYLLTRTTNDIIKDNATKRLENKGFILVNLKLGVDLPCESFLNEETLPSDECGRPRCSISDSTPNLSEHLGTLDKEVQKVLSEVKLN
jgi:GTPase Era involved in 16S rRNA processing